uniref:DUF1989 domain-containing protein n=1 Tax=Timema genevievae TaxID=629358 RepID=A0A7R9PLX4_TIMGE|nr:unnamed protein product [Timema genevievae]
MSGGWCGRGDRPRTFPKRAPVICYDRPKAALVDKQLYDTLRHEALLGECVHKMTVPKRSGRTWTLKKGDLCRITVVEGSQVDTVMQGRSKTRQLHSTHLTVYDRLWSNLPYLRPMATVVADSIRYGIDEDGGSVHDVIGTRCDDYTYKLITGENRDISCHSNLTKAAVAAGLTEEDVHDVWNIFMCTGFTRDTNQYFAKASPGRRGDYIEFIADMDLLVALATCPQGDVSMAVGQEVPESMCYPLGVEVYRSTPP